jgi:protein-tyrosine phosphatase
MKILFVCLGNICRSPTAEGVFRALAAIEGGGRLPALTIDSAGTADYHLGEPPDRRTVAAALARGYDLSMLRARHVQAADFDEFDLLLAMDRANLTSLQRRAPRKALERIRLFMDYAPHLGVAEVPDPYYGNRADFDYVIDLAEAASRGLLAALSSR